MLFCPPRQGKFPPGYGNPEKCQMWTFVREKGAKLWVRILADKTNECNHSLPNPIQTHFYIYIFFTEPLIRPFGPSCHSWLNYLQFFLFFPVGLTVFYPGRLCGRRTMKDRVVTKSLSQIWTWVERCVSLRWAWPGSRFVVREFVLRLRTDYNFFPPPNLKGSGDAQKSIAEGKCNLEND